MSVPEKTLFTQISINRLGFAVLFSDSFRHNSLNCRMLRRILIFDHLSERLNRIRICAAFVGFYLDQITCAEILHGDHDPDSLALGIDGGKAVEWHAPIRPDEPLSSL